MEHTRWVNYLSSEWLKPYINPLPTLSNEVEIKEKSATFSIEGFDYHKTFACDEAQVLQSLNQNRIGP